MDSMIKFLLTILSSLCSFFLLAFYYHHQFSNRKIAARNKTPLPRARGALPIIGHLHLFGSQQLIHKTLGAMAEKYGPVFTIKLGSQQHLVVSSWEEAKECFTTLDKVFSDRPQITATRILGRDMFGFAPYGPYWRDLRKIVTLELLSHRRIDMFGHIRVSEVRTSLRDLYNSWGAKQDRLLVDMKEWFGDVTLNASVRLVGGKRYDGSSGEGRNHQKVLQDFLYYFGIFVLSDAIPWLGWLDLQGHQKSMKRIKKELDGLIEEWLEEHKQRRRNIAAGDQDFMDAMLTILETADDINHFDADTLTKSTCLNLIIAGSDTSKTTLTWALSLLLNNPRVLKEVQNEMNAYVSKDRHVEEADIKNLVYLQAVVKETLRLYPALPFIGLRSAMEDCTISQGYHVPSGTRLMVNIWKIQRDGNIWPEPLQFRPERFLTSHKDIDMRGHDFELLPFGSGRRSCPGRSLALQMVHFTLASLLHCYDFSTPGGTEIDMTETPGLTNLKATPLEVYVTPRLRPEMFDI